MKDYSKEIATLDDGRKLRAEVNVFYEDSPEESIYSFVHEGGVDMQDLNEYIESYPFKREEDSLLRVLDEVSFMLSYKRSAKDGTIRVDDGALKMVQGGKS